MTTTIEITRPDQSTDQLGQFPCYTLAEEYKAARPARRPNKLSIVRAEVVPIPGTQHGPERHWPGAVVWQAILEADPLSGERRLRINGKTYTFTRLGAWVDLSTVEGEVYEVRPHREPGTYSCTCPDAKYRSRPKYRSRHCKHINGLLLLDLLAGEAPCVAVRKVG